MEDHEILLVGEQAQALLDQPLFVQALSARMNGHLEEILGSDDDDAKGREVHFQKLRVYEAVMADLQGLVTRASDLRTRQMAEVAPDDDEDPNY